MGGLIAHLFTLKQIEQLATRALLSMGKPQLVAFARRFVDRISDGLREMP